MIAEHVLATGTELKSKWSGTEDRSNTTHRNVRSFPIRHKFRRLGKPIWSRCRFSCARARSLGLGALSTCRQKLLAARRSVLNALTTKWIQTFKLGALAQSPWNKISIESCIVLFGRFQTHIVIAILQRNTATTPIRDAVTPMRQPLGLLELKYPLV
jgi:hypothetical protein